MSRTSSPGAAPPHPALTAALSRLLRPVVRLLIRRGLTFPAMADLLRGLYVEVARGMLPDERSRTDSRLSLMTGIHRKELRRVRETPDAAEPPQATLGSQLAARWLGQPGLQDGAGEPLPLPRSGPSPSFEALVALVTRDIRPRAVLDEWLASGLARIDEDGRVRLLATAFLPRPGEAEQVYFLGRNLGDHAEAACANATSPSPPFLERAVHYDGLSAAAAERLEELAREAASRMLLEVNRQALAIAETDDRDEAVSERGHRVNLGAFVLRAREP